MDDGENHMDTTVDPLHQFKVVYNIILMGIQDGRNEILINIYITIAVLGHILYNNFRITNWNTK